MVKLPEMRWIFAKATQKYIDIIEIGTALIKHEGVAIV